MNIKDLVLDAVLIGLSASLLWHFSNIWRYGQYLVSEPNLIIRSLETAGLLLILAFGVGKLIGDLKRDRNVGRGRVRYARAGKNICDIQKK